MSEQPEIHDTSDDNGISRTLDTYRRSFMIAGAGATIAATMLGTTAAAGDDDEEYDVVYDIVEDLGADNTGEEPINDALAEAVEDIEYDIPSVNHIDQVEFEENDSVKVVFPEGTYLIEPDIGGEGFARWPFGVGDEVKYLGKLALVGEDGAVLKPTDGGRHPVLTLWGRELLVDNFTIDQTATDTSTGMTTVAGENLYVGNILLDGVADGPYEEVDAPEDVDVDDAAALIPGVLNEDGTGVIEHYRAPDGNEPYGRKLGCWVNFLHEGDLLFTNCEFSKFSDNGIYGSPPGGGDGGGSVRVENSYFDSNNVTAIRLGTEGSYAKDCTVEIRQGEIPVLPWGGLTGRAGWVWYEFDGYYENLDVITDHPSGYGLIDHDSHNGTVDVINCRFRVDASGNDVVRFNADSGGLVTLDSVHVTGDSATGSAIELANRELEATDVCINQTGENRDGISLTNVTGSISDSAIEVTGDQIAELGATEVTTENIADTADCDEADPAPKFIEEDDDEDDDDADVDDTTDDIDDTDDTPADTDDADDGIPGFGAVITLGALATSGVAMLRRLRSTDDR